MLFLRYRHVVLLAAVATCISTGCDRAATTPPPPAAATGTSARAASAPAVADQSDAASTPETPIPVDMREAAPDPTLRTKPPATHRKALPGPVESKRGEHLRRLETYPSDANTMAAVAALTYVHADAAEACNWLDRALAIDNSVPGWHYQRAICLQAMGRGAEAISEIETFLANTQMKFGPGYARMGRLLSESDLPRARAALRRAIEVNGNDCQSRFELGRVEQRAGRTADALAEFLRAAELCPRYAEAHRAAAQLLREAGRADEAERHAQRAARGGEPPADDLLYAQFLVDGMDVESTVAAALEEARNGAFDKAEQLFIRAVGLDESGSASRRGYGLFRVIQGRFDEAATLLEQALEIDGNHTGTHASLGGVYVRLERYAKAIPHLSKAIDSGRDDPLVLQLMGIALTRTGDVSGAERHYLRAVELSPSHAESRMGLVELLLQRKDYEKAVAHLREGIRHAPNDHTMVNALAWVLATCPDSKLRSADEAIKLAQPLCQSGPIQRHEYFDTLAAALAEAGRYREAADHATRAITIATARGERGLLEDYKKRLALYRREKPYHDPE